MVSFGDFFLGTKGKPERFEDVSPEEFQATRGETAEALKGLITSGGGDPFAGPLTAPITAGEQSLVDLAAKQAGETPLSRAAADVSGRTARGEFLTAAPGLEGAVTGAVAPTREAISGLGLPGTGEVDASGRAVAPAAATDPFGRAAQIGAEGARTALTDVEAAIRSRSFTEESGRQQQAIQLASDVASGGLKKTIAGLKATALPRLIADQGIQRGLAEFNARIERLLESINTGVKIGAAVPVKISGTEATTGALQSGLKSFAGFLGGGGTVGGKGATAGGATGVTGTNILGSGGGIGGGFG